MLSMTTIALRNGFRAFWQSSSVDKIVFVVCWLTLAAAAVLRRVLPFKRLAPLLGRPAPASEPVPPAGRAQTARAHIIKRAIRRASAVAPFRADCLPQVLAAACLCRAMRVPFAAYLGVERDHGRDIHAHAWLIVGTTAVTGGGRPSTVSRPCPVSSFA